MARCGAMRMPSPAAMAGAAAQAAASARAPVDTARPRPSIECVMLAFFSQRRAILWPIPCNTVIGKHSTAKRWQCTGPPALDVAKARSKVWKQKPRMTAKGSAVTAARRAQQRAGALDRATFLRPIAHRGLHNSRQGRIENTAPAFLAAIAKGYGIECDLQAAKDGTPMVFHDDKLDRLMGVPGRISQLAPTSLARLRYKGQDAHILTFAEFLALVAGRAPLLVEVKTNTATPLE